MAKPDLGTKRLCTSCSAKFYDLGKTPIVCPKCNTVLELTAVAARARSEQAARAAAAAVPAAEDVVPEPADAEFVSLEDADAEAQGKKAVGDEAVDGAEDDIEIDQPIDDDAALIEEEEESDDDVADLIGDREDEEET